MSIWSVNIKQKALGCDDTSIRIIQLCGKAVAEPWQILLSFSEDSVYLDDWKKSNVVPIHKKESKNLIDQLVSFGKNLL